MAMAEVAVASNGTVTLQPSGPGTSAVLLRLPSSVLRHIADANGVGVRLVLGKNPVSRMRSSFIAMIPCEIGCLLSGAF
jgi:hypothetical protein